MVEFLCVIVGEKNCILIRWEVSVASRNFIALIGWGFCVCRQCQVDVVVVRYIVGFGF